MDKIVCGPEPLQATHSFVRDRTRSIRQDFTLQNDRGVHAIECHERIARYHILCLHQLCEVKGFSQQQEMEQLRKVLQSLTEFYHDAKVNRIECPNEAEFRAFHLLSSLRDPDMARQAQALPIALFLSQPIQHACQLIKLSNRNNEVVGRLKASNCEAALNQFCQFFKIVAGSQTDYLTACLLETNFVDIRKGALKAMRKAYLDRQRPFPARELAAMLGCDSELQVEEICIHYKLEIEVDTSGKAVAVKLHNRSSWDESASVMQQQFSHRIVEAKRHGRCLQRNHKQIYIFYNFQAQPFGARFHTAQAQAAKCGGDCDIIPQQYTFAFPSVIHQQSTKYVQLFSCAIADTPIQYATLVALRSPPT